MQTDWRFSPSYPEPRPTPRPQICVSAVGIPLIFSHIKGENETLKWKVAANDIEIANLTRALSALSDQQRIDAQRFLLEGDVQSDLVGRGTAPRPSSDLFHRQAMNVVEACSQFDPDDVILAPSELEDGAHDPLPDAAQASSVVAFPVTNTFVIDDNSKKSAPLRC